MLREADKECWKFGLAFDRLEGVRGGPSKDSLLIATQGCSLALVRVDFPRHHALRMIAMSVGESSAIDAMGFGQDSAQTRLGRSRSGREPASRVRRGGSVDDALSPCYVSTGLSRRIPPTSAATHCDSHLMLLGCGRGPVQSMFACDRILPFPAAKRQRPVMADCGRLDSCRQRTGRGGAEWTTWRKLIWENLIRYSER
jgi:hypothetical protein